MANWTEKKVIDLQRDGLLLVEDGNHGEYRPRPDEFGAGEFAFIRAADMDGGRVLFESAAKINSQARDRITKGIGAGGDVLLSHKGTVGKLALVPLDSPRFVCSPQTTFWRSLNENKISRRYLYYYMRSDDFRQQLDSRKGETDMAPYVSLTAQRELMLSLPNVETQRAIARILGTLDDKIELNRRMNQTLEGLARALFQSWFAQNESLVVTEAVLSLIDRGILIVGDGYRAKRTELAETGLPFARAGNLDGGFDFANAELLGPSSIAAARDKVSRNFDAAFTSKGTVGRIAQVLPNTPQFVYAPQLCYWRVLKPEGLSPDILFQWMNGAEFREQIDSLKCQTDMADYVSLGDQRDMEITFPFAADSSCISSRLRAISVRKDANIAANKTLAALRDTLLPRLLSGEVRV